MMLTRSSFKGNTILAIASHASHRRRPAVSTFVNEVCFRRGTADRALTSHFYFSSTTTSKDEDSAVRHISKDKKLSHVTAYLELSKAKLSALVVSTTAAGFISTGQPVASQLDVFVSCLLGTALCSSSAAALNQIFEVDRDRQMKRTQLRPLVTGALSVPSALTAAALWGTAGTGLLAFGTDPVTAALGAGNIVLYAGIYTYMKPRSIYNTWVGAVVGAIPPIMGWSAACGGWDATTAFHAFILGSTLYLWQMPHFFALSYMYRVDYERGGFKMLPVVEADGSQTASVIVRYAWYLSAVPVATTLANATSSMFALEGLLLNGYALSVAYRFQRERTNANARKIFLTSLWYLPSWLVLYLLHSRVWDEEKEEDAITKFVSRTVHSIRNKGKDLCPHEVAIKRERDEDLSPGKCPVTLTRRSTVETINAVANSASSVAAAQNEARGESDG